MCVFAHKPNIIKFEMYVSCLKFGEVFFIKTWMLTQLISKKYKYEHNTWSNRLQLVQFIDIKVGLFAFALTLEYTIVDLFI
jgi:hypothetical protein